MAQIRAFVSSVTGIIILVLAALLVVQTVRIEGFKVWPISHKGLKAENADMKRDLKAAREAAERQKKTTSGNITKAREGMKQVEPIARRIETAPPPGNCQTPREILEADL